LLACCSNLPRRTSLSVNVPTSVSTRRAEVKASLLRSSAMVRPRSRGDLVRATVVRAEVLDEGGTCPLRDQFGSWRLVGWHSRRVARRSRGESIASATISTVSVGRLARRAVWVTRHVCSRRRAPHELATQPDRLRLLQPSQRQPTSGLWCGRHSAQRVAWHRRADARHPGDRARPRRAFGWCAGNQHARHTISLLSEMRHDPRSSDAGR
jgi:hypothetical protein